MFLFDVAVVFDQLMAKVLTTDVNLVKLGPDFANFVKNHPRKRLVIENLCQQILAFERGFEGQKHTVDRRNGMILTVVKMFIRTAKKAHEESLLSHAEKIRMTHANQPMEEMKEIFKVVEDKNEQVN